MWQSADDTSPAQGQQQQQPDSSSLSSVANAAGILAADPNLLRDLDTQLGPQDPTPTPATKAPGMLARFWQGTKDFNTKAKQASDDLGSAIERGALKGVDQLSNTLVGGAVGLSKSTGLYKVGRTPEQQDAFLKWWSQRTSDANALQFGDDRIRRWVGPAQGGVLGFVEGASQFATGLATAGKYLEGFEGAQAVAQSGKLGAAAVKAVSGAVSAATALDPHATRLSNLVESNLPGWMHSPVTDFLQAKADDSEPLGRVKNGLEGLLLNSTIEAFAFGLGALRATARGESAAEYWARESGPAKERIEAAKRDELTTVQKTPEGDFAVVHNSPSLSEQVPQVSDGQQPSTVAPALESPASATGESIPEGAPRYGSQGEAEAAAASINYAAKNRSLATGTIEPGDVDAWRKALTAYDEGQDPRSVSELLDSYGVNIKYAQTGAESLNAVKALTDLMPEPSTIARNRPQSWAETGAQAEDLFHDVTPEDAASRAAQIAGSLEKAPAFMRALKVYMWQHASEVRKLSRIADAGPDNPVATDELASALDTLLDLHASYTGAKSSVARALQVEQMPLGDAPQGVAEGTPKGSAEGATEGTAQGTTEGAAAGAPAAPIANDVLADGTGAEPAPVAPDHLAPAGRSATEGLTPVEVRALTRSIFNTDGDPAAMLDILRGPRLSPPPSIATDPTLAKKWFDFAVGFRMNAMLSGPKTVAKIVFNNGLVALQRPLEYWWAGARSNNPALRQFGADMLTGQFANWGDAWSAARRAWLSGQSVLAGAQPRGLPAWSDASFLSKLFNAPSRFHTSVDEFASQLAYRANMRAQILRQARDAGVTDPTQIAERLTEDMKFAFDPQGGAVNPKALEYARVGTFNNALGAGSIGGDIQNFVNAHPLARVIMPFTKKPVNIFRYAWERTPGLNFAMSQYRSDFFGSDPELKALAQSKLDFGLAAYGTAAYLASTGQITGAGPSDPQLRREWREAGNQPYSVKVPLTDRWVSYRSADPTFAPLGLVADLVHMSGELKQDDHDDLAAAAIASIMSNVSSKTYLQGVTEFMDAMTSGRGTTVQHLLNATAGSFIPNVLHQTDPNDTEREARGLIDQMKARLPGFSETLEPRRNLFGEKVMMPPGYFNRSMNPFTVSAPVNNQGVEDELLKVGKGFDMPATTKFEGTIRLTDRDRYDNGTHQSPYDRMLELMASPQDGMPSLRQKLTDLVQSPTWKNMPDSESQSVQRGGEKFTLVNGLIQSYQQMAWAKVQQEYPKLRQAEKQYYQEKAGALTGGQPGVDSVMKKFDEVLAEPRRKASK